MDEIARYRGCLLGLACGDAVGTTVSFARAAPFRRCALADGDCRHNPMDAIRGSGYVVESLETALWCFLTTDSFEAAVLTAANLGDDADTTVAICGQVAGVYYGVDGIPSHWLDRLFMRDEIVELADRLQRERPAG